MKLQSLVLGVLVVATLGLGAFVFTRPAPQEQVGAVPSLPNPLCINGVCEYYFSQAFRTATSTLCDIQTPAATTTVGKITAYFTTSPSYAQAYELGYSATRNATTSALVASWTIPSGGGTLSTISATTTATAPVDGLLSPNTNIVLNASTSTSAGLNQATGICEVRLMTVNGNGTSFSN